MGHLLEAFYDERFKYLANGPKQCFFSKPYGFSFERAVKAASQKLADRNCQGMGLYLTNAYHSQASDAGTYYVISAEAVRRANPHLDLVSPNELSKEGLCTILPESLQRDLHTYLDEKEPPPPRLLPSCSPELPKVAQASRNLRRQRSRSPSPASSNKRSASPERTQRRQSKRRRRR